MKDVPEQENILLAITAFADRAHGAQQRKYTPERYIVHPVRVMKLCREYTSDITMIAAALLHDVLEDTPVTKGQITTFLLTVMPPEQALKTTQLVVELTDVYVSSQYPKLNRKSRKMREAQRMEKISAEAQTVKYADIIDNSTEVVQHDRTFAQVYLRESLALVKRMTKGDPQLYQRALQTMDDCLALLQQYQ